MPFKKGQSGNPTGVQGKAKPWRDAIMRAVSRRESGADPQALEKIADKLVASALNGDMQAMKEIGDRMDGRPAQAVVGDSEADPVKILQEIALKVVDP